MSKCEMYMGFKDEKRTYVMGEEVIGAVKVVVNKDCTCDRIFLRTEWRTHGRGNRTKGGRKEVSLETGVSLRAGQEKMIPFRFTAPNGPSSYRGNYLNVDWYARVQLDIPWALDPKVEEEFILLPGPNPEGVSLGDPAMTEAHLRALKRNPEAAKIGLILFGLIFSTFGLIPVLIGLGLAEGGGKIGSAVFGLIFMAIGGFIMYLGLKNKLAQRKVGPVRIDFRSNKLRPGEELGYTMSLSPKPGTQLTHITSELVGKEIVVSGSGTNQTTHTHRIFHDLKRADMPTARPLELSFVHTLPPNAPTSFFARDNKLYWSVKTTIGITGWPDWSITQPFTVQP